MEPNKKNTPVIFDLFTTVIRLPYSVLKLQLDDTITADRLNYKYTVVLFCFFSILVSNKQLKTDQIICWSPGNFIQNYVAYVNQVCWVSNTYYVGQEEEIPAELPERENRILKYYQWVPFILLLQSFLFHFPRVIWTMLSSKSGLNIGSLVQAARSYQSSENLEDHNSSMAYMVDSVEAYSYIIRKRKNSNANLSRKCLHGEIQSIIGGKYITVLYLFVKILYLTNSFGQLFLLNILLGHKTFHLYGFDIIQNILNGTDEANPVYFPRVSMCDFKVRESTKIHEHTVQCVLPINFINEKVFIFIWFWLAFLTIVNAYDLLVWTIRSVFKSFHYNFVKYRIQLLSQNDRRLRKGACKDFVFRYLQQDSCLVLRIVEANSSDLVVSELINELWKIYNEGSSSDSSKYYGGSGLPENNLGENYASNYSSQYTGVVSKNNGEGRYANYGDSIDL